MKVTCRIALLLVCTSYMSCDSSPKGASVAHETQKITPNPPISSVPIPAADSLALKIRHSWTRSELLAEAKTDLQNLITTLGQAAPTEFVLLNKSKIFAAGLGRLEAFVNRTQVANAPEASEKISIFEHTGLNHPHTLIVNEAQLPVINHTKNWMKYSEPTINTLKTQGYEITFANFANTTLGGGYAHDGNVQEEQMAQMSPDFALILALFNPPSKVAKLFTRKPSEGQNQNDARFASDNSASPLLITQLRFLQNLIGDFQFKPNLIYKNLWDSDKALEDVPNAPAVNMIAMAAPELRPEERGKPYNLALIEDLFNNAYTAYKMVKTYDLKNKHKTYLNVGRWGAGAFKHNVKMVVAIQYLATRLALDAQDQVLFTGLTETQTKDSIQLIDKKIQEFFGGTTPSVKIDSILQSIQNEVAQDNTWNTQP